MSGIGPLVFLMSIIPLFYHGNPALCDFIGLTTTTLFVDEMWAFRSDDGFNHTFSICQ